MTAAKPPTPRCGVPRPTAIGFEASPSSIPQPRSATLQERFQQCKSENALLGELLQDSQAQNQGLKKQLQ
jgi:hypothetical protein